MPEDFDTSLNDDPEENSASGDTGGGFADALREQVAEAASAPPTRSAQPTPDDSTEPQEVDEPAALDEPSLNAPDAVASADKKLPETVPYKALQENVHKRQEAERVASDWQRVAKINASGLARYNSVEELRADEELARADGHPSLEAAFQYIAEQRRLAELETELNSRYDIPEDIKRQHLDTQRALMEANRLNQQASQGVEYTTRQLRTQALSAMEKDLGPLNDELSELLQDADPAVIAKAHSALKRQVEAYADNEVARASTRRAKTAETPAPIGPGGAPARPNLGTQPLSLKQRVSRSLGEILAGGSYD